MKKLALPALLALAGCPTPDPHNPERLYLNLDGSEVMVKLTEVEPGHV